MEDEKLRELRFTLDNKLRHIRDAGWVACSKNELVPKVYETRDQILSLMQEVVKNTDIENPYYEDTLGYNGFNAGVKLFRQAILKAVGR